MRIYFRITVGSGNLFSQNKASSKYLKIKTLRNNPLYGILSHVKQLNQDMYVHASVIYVGQTIFASFNRELICVCKYRIRRNFWKSLLSAILKTLFLKWSQGLASCHCCSVVSKLYFRKHYTVFVNFVIQKFLRIRY